MWTVLRDARRALVLTVMLSTPALSQTIPPVSKEIDLSGPRVGVTVLSDGVLNSLANNSLHVRPLVTQFGWQFEKRLYGGNNGLTAVTEFVVLAGGLEQGVVLPSFSWLAGLRTREGLEFGIGPNVTPAGVALAVAAGVTFRAGNLNVPMNVAVVPSKVGTRISVLTGFNMRRRH